MREIRPSGSEGGARFIPRPYPYLSVALWAKRASGVLMLFLNLVVNMPIISINACSQISFYLC